MYLTLWILHWPHIPYTQSKPRLNCFVIYGPALLRILQKWAPKRYTFSFPFRQCYALPKVILPAPSLHNIQKQPTVKTWYSWANIFQLWGLLVKSLYENVFCKDKVVIYISPPPTLTRTLKIRLVLFVFFPSLIIYEGIYCWILLCHGKQPLRQRLHGSTMQGNMNIKNANTLKTPTLSFNKIQFK